MLDTFPLAEGHVLFSSKKHYGCFGDLPEKMKKEVENFLISLSYKKIIYEHGRAGTCGVNFNACEHFHINIVPSEQEFDYQLDSIPINSLRDIDEYYHEYGEYLLLSSPGYSLIQTNKTIPPHFLRTLVAKHIGKEERANWGSINDLTLFTKSLAKAKELYLDIL